MSSKHTEGYKDRFHVFYIVSNYACKFFQLLVSKDLTVLEGLIKLTY